MLMTNTRRLQGDDREIMHSAYVYCTPPVFIEMQGTSLTAKIDLI